MQKRSLLAIFLTTAAPIWARDQILSAVIGEKYSTLSNYWKGYIAGFGTVLTIIGVLILLQPFYERTKQALRNLPRKIVLLFKEEHKNPSEIENNEKKNNEKKNNKEIIESYQIAENEVKELRLNVENLVNDIKEIVKGGCREIVSLDRQNIEELSKAKIVYRINNACIEHYTNEYSQKVLDYAQNLIQLTGNKFKLIDSNFYLAPKTIEDIDEIAKELEKILSDI